MNFTVKKLNSRSFDAQAVMEKAVSREIRRKKAMGQYMVIFNGTEVEKVDFSLKAKQYKSENQPP